MLVKTSERALRKPCYRCKSYGPTGKLYWYKNSETGRMVLCNADGVEHSTECSKTPEDWPRFDAENPYKATPEVWDAKPAKDDGTVEHKLAEALKGLLPDTSDLENRINERFGSFADDLEAKFRKTVEDLVIPATVIIDRKDGTEPKQLDGIVHEVMPILLKALSAARKSGGIGCKWPLLVGPAGTGKSTIVRQCAEALGVPFYCLSLTPQTTKSDLVGYRVPGTGEEVVSELQACLEGGGIILFDELDNGNPSVMPAIHNALANGHMRFHGKEVAKHADCYFVGGANTFGTGPDRTYVGRHKLDGATLNRWAPITMGYDKALEEALCKATGAAPDLVKTATSLVWAIRRNQESQNLPLIFGTRNLVSLCAYVAEGIPMRQAVNMTVREGTTDADWSKVTQGIDVPS